MTILSICRPRITSSTVISQTFIGLIYGVIDLVIEIRVRYIQRADLPGSGTGYSSVGAFVFGSLDYNAGGDSRF